MLVCSSSVIWFISSSIDLPSPKHLNIEHLSHQYNGCTRRGESGQYVPVRRNAVTIYLLF